MIANPIRFYVPPNSGLRYIAEKIKEYVEEGDILAISSKAISFAEGRLVKLSEVEVSKQGRALAEKYSLIPEIAELILMEAEEILGGVEGFVLTLKFGILCPNAGIDTSNAPEGFAVLYPENPLNSAKYLKKILKTGVVITDSRILPLRRGVVGVALAYSGICGVEDLRGRRDLYGKELKKTFRNVADMLASAANLLMGEADEMIPAVVFKDHPVKMGNDELNVSVRADECLYGKLINCGKLINKSGYP